jgi:hypothetical protein
MNFKITEVSLDADCNVTINGYYNKDGVKVGDDKAFQFNLDDTPHSSKAEFLAACKARIEAGQPAVSAKELQKIALAEQARDLLTEYVDQNITLKALT